MSKAYQCHFSFVYNVAAALILFRDDNNKPL
jgi:hypothetical protein